MRSSDRFGIYWIDAICIDQTNVRERNHQVQMMRQIYSNAESVFAWLGEEDSTVYTNVGMDFLAQRESLQAQTANVGRFWTPRQAKAVLALCERPYWTRMWIIQEILLANEITICCGSKAMPWYHLQRFFDDVASIVLSWGQHIRLFPVLESAASGIVKAKSGWAGQQSQSLLNLLKLCRDQHSTDIRDKIYALHGLANDTSGLDVDYGITPEQLLLAVLKHACEALETSMSVRQSRKTLLRTGQLLRDVLKAHCDDELLEAVVSAKEHYLTLEEDIVIAQEARITAEENRLRLAAAEEKRKAEEARRAEEARCKEVTRIKSVMWYLEGYEGQSTPQRYCYFRFLRCPYETMDAQDWRAHCLDHFLLRHPPQAMTCVFCHESSSNKELQYPHEWKTGIWACRHQWRFNPKHNGWVAWNLYMTHIQEHHATSHIRDPRLERRLYGNLHSMHIINEQELAQLREDKVLHQFPAEYIRVAEGRENNEVNKSSSSQSDLHPKRREVAQRLLAIAQSDHALWSSHVLRVNLKEYCESQEIRIDIDARTPDGQAEEVRAKAWEARHAVMSKARRERPWSTSATARRISGECEEDKPGEEVRKDGQDV